MLRIIDLSIRFGENPDVVYNTSFDVEEKKTTCIIGETGSGKSVILLALLGLLSDNADIGGSIMLNERQLLNSTEKEWHNTRIHDFSYIPQGSGNGLNPLYTVEHQLIETLQISKKMPKKQGKMYCNQLLKSLGFDDIKRVLKSYPHQLSGGMRQRVLISMGLASDAHTLLVDEPTKGLDSNRIALVVEMFQNISDRTILCVTHDLNFAKEIGNTILVMYASELIESCNVNQFFSNPLHPYSQSMISALPENGLVTDMGFAPPREDAEREIQCKFIERCTYKTERCQSKPPLLDIDENRKVRCWHYVT